MHINVSRLITDPRQGLSVQRRIAPEHARACQGHGLAYQPHQFLAYTANGTKIARELGISCIASWNAFFVESCLYVVLSSVGGQQPAAEVPRLARLTKLALEAITALVGHMQRALTLKVDARSLDPKLEPDRARSELIRKPQ